jgi:hypothetical protein
MTQPHLAWLAKWQREVEEEYGRLHAVANQDPQQPGHGGEGDLATPSRGVAASCYEVGTRKYIVPEDGSDVFEPTWSSSTPAFRDGSARTRTYSRAASRQHSASSSRSTPPASAMLASEPHAYVARRKQVTGHRELSCSARSP